MPMGPLAGVSGNSVMAPSVVMRPILSIPVSVNQTLPSGPAVIPLGKLYLFGSANSCTELKPRGVTRQGPGPGAPGGGAGCGRCEHAPAMNANTRNRMAGRTRNLQIPRNVGVTSDHALP